MAKNQNMEISDLIAEANDSMVEDYDIVIMDPPPALGMVSMAVLQAANCMVIPVPPSLVDFASTVSFIDMTRTTMKQLEQITGRGRPAYNFIRLVGSRVDETKSMQEVYAETDGAFVALPVVGHYPNVSEPEWSPNASASASAREGLPTKSMARKR